jgi:RNA polymerase sigma-70 factor (ECF subfamily)
VSSQRAYLRSVGAAPGDPLEQAFRANATVVFAVVVRILGSSADAEDLLQDLFIVALRDLRELRHPAATRQWFITAAVRLARRRLQRQRLVRFFGADDPTYDDAISPDASPDQQTLLRSVFRVLVKLPAADRIAWTLRHIEGMQLGDVSAACDCSVATVKRRIAAAQAAIEEALSDA